MLRRIFLYFLSEKREVSVFNDFNLLRLNRTIRKTGCEGEWSAFDPLPKLTQASEKDVRIIIGKERESYEPEFNSRIRGRKTEVKIIIYKHYLST